MPSFLGRITTRRAAILLGQKLGANKLLAAGGSFWAASSLHYVWPELGIPRHGTERSVATGYGYFLINPAVGMALSVSLFAALLSWTSPNYLVARVIVSAFSVSCQRH